MSFSLSNSHQVMRTPSVQILILREAHIPEQTQGYSYSWPDYAQLGIDQVVLAPRRTA